MLSGQEKIRQRAVPPACIRGSWYWQAQSAAESSVYMPNTHAILRFAKPATRLHAKFAERATKICSHLQLYLHAKYSHQSPADAIFRRKADLQLHLPWIMADANCKFLQGASNDILGLKFDHTSRWSRTGTA